MCAVETEDLHTYLVDKFDYVFFPCVQDKIITIKSESISDIEVFGSVDYDIKYPVEGNTFTVTKSKTSFPSALILNKQGKVETKGGLILVKFTPKNAEGLPKIDLKLNLYYSNIDGQNY